MWHWVSLHQKCFNFFFFLSDNLCSLHCCRTKHTTHTQNEWEGWWSCHNGWFGLNKAWVLELNELKNILFWLWRGCLFYVCHYSVILLQVLPLELSDWLHITSISLLALKATVVKRLKLLLWASGVVCQREGSSYYRDCNKHNHNLMLCHCIVSCCNIAWDNKQRVT